MKILVANIKGGMGKTHFALNAALRYEFNVLTNDEHSRIDLVLGADALILDEQMGIPATPDGFNVIYDMGGKADARLIDAAKLADVVAIPVIMDTFFDVQATIATIDAIEKHNPNILIIANKTQKGDLERVTAEIRKHYQYPVMELKQSTAFKTAIHKKQSIRELINGNPFRSYHFSLPAKQLEDVMEKLASMTTEPLKVAA